MKSCIRIITAAALVLSFTAPSALATHLPSVRSYENAVFTDVPDDWSLPYIKTCYELGLMSGQSGERFGPGGTVSAAEGVTVAARVHNLWSGGNGILPESNPWYSSAVEYGISNGLLTQGQFTDYSVPATRAQLVGLLARALPDRDYAPINEISALPDVGEGTPYAADILKLYNAGVLTGNDVYGTFSPNSPITRAELTAILCRLVWPQLRRSLSLWSPGQTDGPIAGEDTHPLDAASFDAALSDGSLMVVFFYADWCQPCHLLTPTIDQLALQYRGRVPVGKVNVDQELQLTERYNITGYPSVLFFQDGQEFDRQTGIHALETYTAILDGRL